jgi:hypothetical protein
MKMKKTYKTHEKIDENDKTIGNFSNSYERAILMKLFLSRAIK